MSYKPGFLRGAIIAFALFFVCAMRADAQSWTSLSQSQRNALIVAQARHDVGLTGGNCKTWVNNVVYVASSYVRNLPATATWPATGETNAAYWWNPYDPNFAYVTGQTAQNLSTVPSGSIIQMRVKNQSTGVTYPHTAIVESNYNGTMYLLESNYRIPYVVTRRGPLTYADFLATLENPTYYTVYQIK